MSTNYYFRESLGVGGTQETHLGKRSVGWPFLFHSFHEVDSFAQLVGFLENTPGEVVNEYGDTLNPVEFVIMASNWGYGKPAIENRRPMRMARADSEGYWFVDLEFC